MLTHTLKIELPVTTAITLWDDMVDVYITFSKFPATTHTCVPTMVARILAKISVSIAAHFFCFSFPPSMLNLKKILRVAV